NMNPPIYNSYLQLVNNDNNSQQVYDKIKDKCSEDAKIFLPKNVTIIPHYESKLWKGISQPLKEEINILPI
ncbi:MAG: hypothetical protein MHPSP_004067, partial [Paramarteilia canceri]